MKLKHLLFGACALFGSYVAMGQEAEEDHWYVIGEFCGWKFDNAVEMTRESSDTYTVTMEKLEGKFKFAMPGWENDYGYDIDVTGNCSFYLESKGANLSATTPLENVSITLNFRSVVGGVTALVTFSGLPTDMEVPDKPTKLSSGSPVFYDLSRKNPIGKSMKNEEDGIYTYTSSFETGEKFVIADAVFIYPAKMDSTERWTYLRDFEYGPAEASDSPLAIKLGDSIKLKYPAEKDAVWEIQEAGIYNVVVDPVNLKLSLEKPVWDNLYICGNVMDPATGVTNDFLAPSAGNLEIYENSFKLIKRKIEGKEYYQGFYRLVPKVETITSMDDYAQFRFFRALLGWTEAASLGSTYGDFLCEEVILENGKASWPIIETGLGNWGFPVDYSTPMEQLDLEITVDLENMIVYFGPFDPSGIEKIENVSSDVPELWYNTQGMRVSNPGSGLYIRMKGEKCEKIIR